MLFHSSLFLKFWVSSRDTRKLDEVEVGNLKLLFLLCADAYLDNTSDCFYNFPDLQQSEFFVLYLCEFFQPIIFFVAKKIFASSLLSNNIHVPTGNNLFVSTKIKFLMIKLITNVEWKICWDFLTAI